MAQTRTRRRLTPGAARRQIRDWLAEAYRLKDAKDERHIDFLYVLRGLQRRTRTWRDARPDAATFRDFLRLTNLCKWHRFMAFREAASALHETIIREIGIEASLEIMTLPEGLRPDGIATVQAWVRLMHVRPSRQKTKALLAEALGLPRPTPRRPREELEEEIERLRRENADLLRNQTINGGGVSPSRTLTAILMAHIEQWEQWGMEVTRLCHSHHVDLPERPVRPEGMPT